ncbi:unnamed protein product [Symbiodinium sp. CCMP2456]|nr:unnamed protein product [Symbiodinium sp. CCMP2456]
MWLGASVWQGRIGLQYTPGHAGVLGNELADLAAKSAVAGCPLGELNWHVAADIDWWGHQGALWSWCSVVLGWAMGDDALPSPVGDRLNHERDHGGLSPAEIVQPFAPEVSSNEVAVAQGLLHLRVASYNALSLATEKTRVVDEGIAFQAARPALLASQLEKAGVCCAAIQEARTAPGHLVTGPFLRYCSGSARGHLGVEMWFLKGHAFVTAASGVACHVAFEPSAFVVLANDPRRLLVSFKQGSCQWKETELLLHREGRGKCIVVGADCNASLGSVESEAVSCAGAEEQDLAGDMLHSLLRKCELWAPATWDGVQSGPTWTFMQRRNGALARPDFVFIPAAWRQGKVSAWTDPDVSTANMVIDHLATVVEVRVPIQCNMKPATKPKPRIDVKALCAPANRQKLEELLSQVPRPPWHTSAHAHVAIVTKHLQETLAEAFPLDGRRPLHPFLSDVAWGLQKEVAWLRRKCARTRDFIRQQTMIAVFTAWQSRATGEPASSAWLRDAQLSGALYGFRLGFLAKALKARCKQDRAAYMESLADEVQTNPATAFHAVNRLMCRRRRKPYEPTVLPAVLNSEGHLCTTPEETIRRWREHFSSLEDGVDTSVWTLGAAAMQPVQEAWPLPGDLSSMPTPVDLQSAILAAKRGKACGPDRIPGELGLAAAPSLQPCLQRHYDQTASSLHLSGRKGGCVLFGSHAVRAFTRWKVGQGGTAVVLFADVASAYYATPRELAARGPGQEAPGLEDQLGTAHLHNDDELDPMVQQQRPSALAQDRATPWLQALTWQLNTGTWMHLSGDTVPVATNRGTRPGSAWADLTFGVIIGRVLRVRDACRLQARTASCVPRVPWDGCRSWQPVERGKTAIPLCDVVWADDLSECLSVDCAGDTGRIAATEAGHLADAFASHSLDLSFGPRKTAAIASIRGPGSRAVRRSLFAGDATLAVLRENCGASRLPLVTRYRHLGVQQATDGKIHCEVKSRIAAAWGAFREGRTRVFRCKRVAIHRRGVLLETLVMRKLTFGAGAWPPLGACDLRLFAGAVTSLYRAVICVKPQDDQHLSVSMICALVGQVDHATLLKVEQLRYVRQLVAAAPDELWALVRLDEHYLALLRDALAWLYERVQTTVELPHPLVDWTPWCQLMVQRPGRYRGIVKRAKGLEMCRIQCHAALQALYRTFQAIAVGHETRSTQANQHFTEACLICKKGFVSRSAWAMHSSKLHGYRIAASILLGSDKGTLCRGCGKCYASSARLRRHLLHAHNCRKQWGAFELQENVVVPCLHSQQPPLSLEGVLELQQPDIVRDDVHPGLLRALKELGDASAEAIWATVTEFVEPLAVLRRTLEAWRSDSDFPLACEEALEDALLQLDPDVCCDTYCHPKRPCTSEECCTELPGPFDTHFAFIMTGAVATFKLDEPPCPAFAYPFKGGAPLSSAKKQAAYVVAACDVIGLFAQQSKSSRVFLCASRRALAALEPAATWLASAGFIHVGEGFHSPAD